MKFNLNTWPNLDDIQIVNLEQKEAKAFLSLAGKTDDLSEIILTAKNLQTKFSDMVVIGAGGSGMSGKLLATLSKNKTHTVHVLDNLDQKRIEVLLSSLNPEKTFVLLISKSGTTIDVAVCADFVFRWLAEKRCDLSKHAGVVTVLNGNVLHKYAHENNLQIFSHDEDLCGRFSILSIVGLLPAAFVGVDVELLRTSSKFIEKENIAKSVSAQAKLIKAGKTSHVMMVYDEALLPFAMWWRQVFSESLGKEGRGAGAIVSLGPRDQHSQLQLYMEGQADKYFTFISSGKNNRQAISTNAFLPEIRGKNIDDVIDAMLNGTMQALVDAGKAVRHIRLDNLGEEESGKFLQTMMVETASLAEAIDIDAFSQPAVEFGKKLTLKYLL